MKRTPGTSEIPVNGEGFVRIEEMEEGYPVVVVDTELCRAKIAVWGAHLFSFVPKGKGERLFLSEKALFEPGKAIRGGIPLCWPWFGARKEEKGPSHGFARNSLFEFLGWEREGGGTVVLRFSLENDEEKRRLWPFDFRLEISFRLGETLAVEMKTYNVDDVSWSVSQALHTYFSVDDIERVSIEGLEGCRYLDQLTGETALQKGVVRFSEEVDRIYEGRVSPLRLLDGKGCVTIESEGSRSCVVWNPWIEKSSRLPDMGREGYRRMVCVETANVRDDTVTLEPGSSHTLSVKYVWSD